MATRQATVRGVFILDLEKRTIDLIHRMFTDENSVLGQNLLLDQKI